MLKIGSHTFASRLFVGTGKYDSYDVMQQALDLSGAECITVAVRRERLFDKEGRNLLDYIDTKRYTILPNTAGCFSIRFNLSRKPHFLQAFAEQLDVFFSFASA
jgi:thiazole synthase